MATGDAGLLTQFANYDNPRADMARRANPDVRYQIWRPGRLASADVHQCGLALYRKVVTAIDQRFALSMPVLMSASSKKSISSAS